jgi:hypothetical protein
MDKILYIGGVGSDTHLVKNVSDALSTYFKTNVVGFSFSEATQNRAQIARIAPDALVITHSAGMVLLKDSTPREVLAIAPPMPSVPSMLVWRSFPKTMALLASGREARDRPRKLLSYHVHSAIEHIRRPYGNSMYLKEISFFDAAKSAVELTKMGAKVTLGFMENDRLFPYSAGHPHIELAKNEGVEVLDTVLGHHDEFILYPLEVLAQLEQLGMKLTLPTNE